MAAMSMIIELLAQVIATLFDCPSVPTYVQSVQNGNKCMHSYKLIEESVQLLMTYLRCSDFLCFSERANLYLALLLPAANDLITLTHIQ